MCANMCKSKNCLLLSCLLTLFKLIINYYHYSACVQFINKLLTDPLNGVLLCLKHSLWQRNVLLLLELLPHSALRIPLLLMSLEILHYVLSQSLLLTLWSTSGSVVSHCLDPIILTVHTCFQGNLTSLLWRCLKA